MKKLSILLFAMAFTPPAFAEAFKTGSYFVKETVLEERLTPNQKGKVKNKIYRLQKVDVLEDKGDWARVSKYYDGEAEGEKGQVARWVLIKGLSTTRPSDLPQPTIKSDPRVLKEAIPKVGEYGLKVQGDAHALNMLIKPPATQTLILSTAAVQIYSSPQVIYSPKKGAGSDSL